MNFYNKKTIINDNYSTSNYKYNNSIHYIEGGDNYNKMILIVNCR